MTPLPPAQERALALAARHVRASTPAALSEAALLAAIRCGRAPSGYRHHVFAVLDETDTAMLAF